MVGVGPCIGNWSQHATDSVRVTRERRQRAVRWTVACRPPGLLEAADVGHGETLSPAGYRRALHDNQYFSGTERERSFVQGRGPCRTDDCRAGVRTTAGRSRATTPRVIKGQSALPFSLPCRGGGIYNSFLASSK